MEQFCSKNQKAAPEIIEIKNMLLRLHSRQEILTISSLLFNKQDRIKFQLRSRYDLLPKNELLLIKNINLFLFEKFVFKLNIFLKIFF